MDLFKGKKLFSPQKDDPEFLERQAKSRHGILKNLSRVVKEVQLLYTRTEGDGLGDSRPVQRLCARFEDVLRHGLKLGWFGVKGKQPTFWPLVSKISRKQAIDYINSLQYAQSDSGKCRAWIRLAANECSLESYIAVLCHDTNLLSQYYETHSFMRDQEMVVALQQLLTGLSQIAFSITVDTASLEIAPAPEVLQPALRLRAPQPVENTRRINEDTPSVSSVSTPLASSSSSSWLSDTSSQLQEDRTPRVNLPDEDIPIDTVKDEKSGLEASVKIEGDTFVIDVLANPVKSSNDLNRFNNIDYDDEVWDRVVDNEGGRRKEPTPLRDVVSPRRGSRRLSNADLAKREGMTIEPPGEEEGKGAWNDGEEKVLVDESNHETPPSLASPVQQCEPSPPPTMEPPLGYLDDTPPQSTPDFSVEETPTKATPPEIDDSHDTPISEERPRVDSMPEEQSFYDILRLATGITDTLPSSTTAVTTTDTVSTSDTVSSPDTRLSSDIVPQSDTVSSPDTVPSSDTVSSPDIIPSDTIPSSDTISSSSDDGRQANGAMVTTNERRERNGTLTSEGHEGEPPIDHVTSTNELPSSLNPFDNPESTLTQKDLPELYTPDSPKTPIVEHRHLTSPQVTPPTSDQTTPPFIMVSPVRPSSPPRTTTPSNVTTPPSVNMSPFVITPPSAVTSPNKNDRNPFSDSPPSPTSNPFDPTYHTEPVLSPEDLADTNPFLSDILNEAKATAATNDGEQVTATGRTRSHHFSRILDNRPDNKQELLIEEEDDEREAGRRFLAPLKFDAPEVREDYFSPELSLSDIDSEIEKFKALVIHNKDNEGLKKALVELQLRRQKAKDLSEEKGVGEEVLGHILYHIQWKLLGQKCDTCNKPGVAERMLQCRGCGYLCHSKCKSQIIRKCVAASVKDRYIMSICPEKSLSYQHFRCSSCNVSLNEGNEVRQCDYNGMFLCTSCHHNDLCIIPARVVHNWDFAQRRVCISCCELLGALTSRPLINIKTINTSLYTYIQDITAIESLRDDIMRMKPYLVACDRAREEKLLQELDPWPHFKDSADMFSLNDLISIHRSSLLPQLQAVHEIFMSHIRSECEVCINRGGICNICRSREVLFSFSKEAIVCSTCSTLYHRECFQSVRGVCPACKKQRTIDSIMLQ